MKSFVGISLLMLLASCSTLQPRAMHISDANDIADNPAILFNGSVSRDEMTLHGVHLGDPRSAILTSRIAKEADGGWIVCSDGSRYRIENDVVVTLGLWNYDALDHLEIHSRDQIEPKFGKADAISDTGAVIVYRFDSKHVSVLWHRYEDRIIGVNISREEKFITKNTMNGK